MEGAPTAQEHRLVQQVIPDVRRLRILFVNAYFCGSPESWVLVDAGLQGSADYIKRAAEACFGKGTRPEAIVLTHGHFDHVGALPDLAEQWDVPVYAHELELPYLTGESAYPPPDPTVGGGAMALMSWMYPRGAIDLGERVKPFPGDGTVPHMPGWRWIHTPGHTPGHVSLFRESDRCLIAGDAFVTVKQESLYAVATQRQELHGPPAYFTTNWEEARQSVERLASLNPSLAATGHGRPLQGMALKRGLQQLAEEFEHAAIPPRGRYVRQPALADEHGVVAVPPPIVNAKVVGGVGLLAFLGAAFLAAQRDRSG